MLVLGIVHILDPLLELSVLTHLHRRELGHCLGEGLLIGFVNSKFCGGCLCSSHYIHNDLCIHCTACCKRVGLANAAVLRAYGRNNYKVTVVGVNLHIVKVEVSGSLDNRIPLLQEILVLCEEIVLPEVGGKPGASVRIHTPVSGVNRACNSPEVGVVMGNPSAASVHLAGGYGSGNAQVPDH